MGILVDHLDQTKTHVEETQRADSALAALTVSLAAAKDTAEASAAARRRVEENQATLELEVRHTEDTLASERDQKERSQTAEKEKECEVARKSLTTINQHAAKVSLESQRAEAAALQVERASRENVQILRSKLEELWQLLRATGQELPETSSQASPVASVVSHISASGFGFNPQRRRIVG